MESDDPIVSTSPSSAWDQGVAAGTGVVGAIVSGDSVRLEIALAHERFFLPANSRRPAPDLAPALAGIRDALGRKDAAAAADLVDRRLREVGWDPDDLVWTDPLAPVGRITWSPGPAHRGRIERHLDPSRTDARVIVHRADGTRWGLTVEGTRGEPVLRLRLWSEGPLDGRLALEAVSERRPGGEDIGVVEYGQGIEVTGEPGATRLRLVTTARGVEPGTDAAATTTLESAVAREVDGGGWRIEVDGDAEWRVHVGVDISGDRFGDDDAPDQHVPPEDLLSRSRLRLGGERAPDDTVETLWQRARADDGALRGVLELAYAACRRNIVASTGRLPPTLQGVWQGTWSPAWSSDYTLNGNVQNGAFASILWTGTPELMNALFRLVRAFRDDYRGNAANLYGAPGMMLPARMTTHGHANHFIRSYPHQWWLGHGPWFLRLAADYVLVTGDRTPIDGWLWDDAREILDFVGAVVRDGGGRLSPAYSPENTPGGTAEAIATDPTMDVAAIRDAVRIGTWLAELRGDPDRATAWVEAAELLPPLRVADDGTLAEWSGEWAEEIGHRHSSQLYPLWYVPDPAFDDPALRAAALRTIRAKIAWRAEEVARGAGMQMAFGLAQLGVAAATLGAADEALTCARWLACEFVAANLMTTHDWGEIFNLDASGSFPAIVAAMLAASVPGRLRVLPALPTSWPEGSITGLGLRGGSTLAELRWEGAGFTARIEPTAGAEWLRGEVLEVRSPRPVVEWRVDGRTVDSGVDTVTIPTGRPVVVAARYAPSDVN